MFLARFPGRSSNRCRFSVVKITKSGANKWDKLEQRLRPFLDELIESPGAPRKGHLDPVPEEAGIYLFVDERGRPLYVGQTRNLRSRLAQHCRPGSKHTSASLAFNLAKEDLYSKVGEEGWKRNYEKLSRSQLEQHRRFKKLFKEARERLDGMTVHYKLCSDPELRTVLEVYITLMLNTPLNKFETH